MLLSFWNIELLLEGVPWQVEEKSNTQLEQIQFMAQTP